MQTVKKITGNVTIAHSFIFLAQAHEKMCLQIMPHRLLTGYYSKNKVINSNEYTVNLAFSSSLYGMNGYTYLNKQVISKFYLPLYK